MAKLDEAMFALAKEARYLVIIIVNIDVDIQSVPICRDLAVENQMYGRSTNVWRCFLEQDKSSANWPMRPANFSGRCRFMTTNLPSRLMRVILRMISVKTVDTRWN